MSKKMTDMQALLDAHQSIRLLRLPFVRNNCPQAALMVNRFEGTEYQSLDFEFKVESLSDDAGIELEATHGKLPRIDAEVQLSTPKKSIIQSRRDRTRASPVQACRSCAGSSSCPAQHHRSPRYWRRRHCLRQVAAQDQQGLFQL